MIFLIELIPPVKLATIPKKISGKSQKVAKILPCSTKNSLKKDHKELLYQINKFNCIETIPLETPKISLIDIYV